MRMWPVLPGSGAALVGGIAWVWDAVTGDLMLKLEIQTGGLLAAAFSPDGKRIVSAGADRTARIWDSRPFRDTRPPDPDPELAPPPRVRP